MGPIFIFNSTPPANTAAVYWNNYQNISGYGELGAIQGYNPIANETAGRAAILAGLDSSLIGGAYANYSDQQVSIRLADGTQQGPVRFDYFIVSGNKRYAFNYDPNASFPMFYNITPVFYVWQGFNLTATQIAGNVSALINSTA
jgi:hypothetical protein